MFESIVLGLDPGLTRCGWGVLGVAGAKLRAVDHGVVCTPREAPVGERLLTVHVAVRQLLAEHRPSAVALERVLFNVNVQTAMATGQAAGVVLLACAEAGVEVTSYSPSQVKSAISGFGAAAKPQMRHAVRRQLGLSAEPQTDAADALALAICHAATRRLGVALEEALPKASRRPSEKWRAAVAAAVANDVLGSTVGPRSAARPQRSNGAEGRAE